MKELLAIEFLKIKHFNVFKVFVLLFMIIVPMLYWSIGSIHAPFLLNRNAVFHFPMVWPYLTYFASLCMIFPAIFVIVLVCNDFSYRTQKQNIIDGLSRTQVLLAKFYLILIFTIFITIFVFIVGLIFGSIYSSITNAFNGIEYLGYFALQTFGFLILAFLISITLRKTSLSVIIYLVIFFILGLIILSIVGLENAQFSPINVLNDLVPNPYIQRFNRMANNEVIGSIEFSYTFRIVLSLIYISIFIGLTRFTLNKRDL